MVFDGRMWHNDSAWLACELRCCSISEGQRVQYILHYAPNKVAHNARDYHNDFQFHKGCDVTL